MSGFGLWDVDTQRDFMLPKGKLYVKGAEKLRPNLKKLYAAAKKARLPVVATADTYDPRDDKLDLWPPHCLRGTEGQRKISETLLPRRVTIPPNPANRAPELRPGVQVVLEKHQSDAFTNPAARAIVEKSGVDHWIVFGVATDYGVRLAALGLLRLGRQVTVVSDAIQGAAPESSRQAVIEMQAAGADFKTAAAVAKALVPSRSKAKKRKDS